MATASTNSNTNTKNNTNNSSNNNNSISQNDDNDAEIIEMSSDGNENTNTIENKNDDGDGGDGDDGGSFSSQEDIFAQPVSMQSMFTLKLRGYTPLYSREHLPEIKNRNDLSKIEIKLTEDESKVFDEFMEAINSDFFPQKKNGENVIIMRAAGGWVRDKLLGIQSDDIDIAIDKFTGEQWGDCFLKWFEWKKEQVSKNDKNNKNRNKNNKCNFQENIKMGKIKENPDKSKHLAAITFKYHNLDFDIVNLRKEEYSKGSRVPRIEFGTAEEDAYRRDLTFNSLFYNINTREIEDFTGRGVNDLKQGIARTPLAALETYRDDPLRVFRNIRHAVTKFGFMLNDDIVEAAQQAKIHQLLETKVTRERFSTEIVKILEGYYVVWALKLMVDFNLAPILFHVPSEDGFDENECCVVNRNEKELIENKGELFAMGLRYANKLNDLMLDYYTHHHNVTKSKESLIDDKETKDEKDNTNNSNNSSNSSNSSSSNNSNNINNSAAKPEICEIKNDNCNDIHVKDIHNYLAKEKERDIMLSTFLYPWNAIEYRMKNRVDSIVMYFVLYSMPGLSRDLGKIVVMYHKSTNYLLQLISKEQEQVKNKNKSENSNVSIFEKKLLCGLFLNESKQDWEHVLWLVKTVAYFEFRIDVKFVETELKPWIYSNLFKEYSVSKIRPENSGKKQKKQKKKKNKSNDNNENELKQEKKDLKILVGCWRWPSLKDGNQLHKNKEYAKHGLTKDKRMGYLMKCLKYLQLCDSNINDSKIDLFVFEWLDLFAKEFEKDQNVEWKHDRIYSYVVDWIIKDSLSQTNDT